jgi:Protein of unknown function (DUF2933)
MNTLFFLALLLVCPVMMMLMMRGMHGGGQSARELRPANLAGDSDRRIADLEREVATLRGQRSEPGQVIDRRREGR